MIAGRSVRDIARDVLALSRQGLARRARLDHAGGDETRYLDPLDGIVASGMTYADRLAAKFQGEWGGDIDRVFAECAL